MRHTIIYLAVRGACQIIGQHWKLNQAKLAAAVQAEKSREATESK